MTSVTAITGILADDYWGHHDWGGGWWVAMAIGMVLFWGLAVAGIVWLVRTSTGAAGHPAGPAGPQDPLDILGRRLALGEISVEEYERRRATLEGRAEAPGPAGESG